MAGVKPVLTQEEADEIARVLTGWGLIVTSVNPSTGELTARVPPAFPTTA